jgi:serine/threonine protein kinase
VTSQRTSRRLDPETDLMDAQSAPHPTDQTLHYYGRGQLDRASADSINTHLQNCPACRRRVAELSSDSLPGRARDAQGRPASPVAAGSSATGRAAQAAERRPPAPAARPMPPPGLAEHPDYEILRELGRSDIGSVYLVQNKLQGRHEVLRVVDGQLAKRPEVLDRFLGMIRNAARLHHPNIVTAYSALRIGEALVLAVEYVEGLDLARLVRAKGALPIANACNCVHQAALGLQHAHEQGLVHGDIKPGNLLLARQGDRAILKILDFGLARVRREHVPAGTLTPADHRLDTPAFMAPEQTGDPSRADIRADIYSLGCTFYFLLTGNPPFQGANLYDLLQAHQSVEATPLNLARPDVPMPLAIIVATMMAKEPEQRFATPRDVSKALAPFIKKENPAPRASTPQTSRAETASGFQLSHGTGSAVDPQSVKVTEPPAPPRAKPTEPTSPGSEWGTFIEIRQDDDLSKEVQALREQRGSRAWLWPAAAVGGLALLGLAVMLGMSIEARRRPAVGIIPTAPTAPLAQVAPSAPASKPIESPSTRTEAPAPPRPALGPSGDRPTPPKKTVVARNENAERSGSLDEDRRPANDPPVKEQPAEPTPAPKPIVAEKKPESVAAEPAPEDGSPEAVLARRGLSKSGRFYTIATESEVHAAWQGVVPFYNLMDAARAEFVEAMEIVAYAQELNDNLINLQAYINDLNSLMGRANRDQQVLLRNQLQEANARLNLVQAELAKVRTRLVSPERRQELQDQFMKRRSEFLAKSGELRPILNKMNAEYAKLKQDDEVTSVLKALKERQKVNVTLGPSDKLNSLLRQLRQAEEAVSLNPDAYRSKKKSIRLEGKDGPKGKAGAMPK